MHRLKKNLGPTATKVKNAAAAKAARAKDKLGNLVPSRGGHSSESDDTKRVARLDTKCVTLSGRDIVGALHGNRR